MMISPPSWISWWLTMLDFGPVRLMSICVNWLKTLRILSSGGLLTVISIQTFTAWLWTISTSQVCNIFVCLCSHLINFTPNSHINCRRTHIFTGPATPFFHSQQPQCFTYSRVPLSQILGPPRSHFYWRCSCRCEGKFQEEVGGIWFRSWGYWVVTMSWTVVCHL